jgi:hypothetical protein
MNYSEIIQEINSGKNVYWKNQGYKCILANFNKLYVVWDYQGKNENAVELSIDNFHRYQESDFFIV